MKDKAEISFEKLNYECQKVLVGVGSSKKDAILKIFQVMADEIVFLVKRLSALESESNLLRHENAKLLFRVGELKSPPKENKRVKNRDN